MDSTKGLLLYSTQVSMQQISRTQYILSDPDILGGTPVFAGTRVPISILFEYLQQSTVEEFLKGYPHITREMVNAVLYIAAQRFEVKAHRPAYESAA